MIIIITIRRLQKQGKIYFNFSITTPQGSVIRSPNKANRNILTTLLY